MESPDMIRAGAIISANLPTAGNNHCQVAGQPVAMMIVNGTDDPINPYEGGHVKRLGSWRSSGEVLSTVESAQFWARQAGYSGDPFIHHYPDIAVDDGTVAVRSVWSTDGHKEINLITVHGGGHTIPHPDASFPRLLGKTNRDISAPKEIWRFFQREMAD
jgi:polyhydroxybutyrate depolymerase